MPDALQKSHRKYERLIRGECRVLALTYSCPSYGLSGLLGINSDHSVLASTYSCRLCRRLPSAQTGLTTEFGMGSGVTPSIETPGQNDQCKKESIGKLSSRVEIGRADFVRGRVLTL